eukprot:GEMP01065933.1.p1 GENE.GEMP01065933.1~~GEMP01065933.1.p1  ORF type:complete len:298 (+),score=67.51 GEMP01065933.1:60-953(+)
MDVYNWLTWNVADVCVWAREMNYPQDLVDAFTYYRVDGPTLAEITEKDLEGIIKDDLMRKEIATHARYFRLQRAKYGFLIQNPGVMRSMEYSNSLAPIFPKIIRGSKIQSKLTSPSASPKTKPSVLVASPKSSAESILKPNTTSSPNNPTSPNSRRRSSLQEATDIEPRTTIARNTIISLGDEIQNLEHQSKLQEKAKESLERDLMSRAEISTKQQVLFDRHLRQQLDDMQERYEIEMDFMVETTMNAQEENDRLREIIATQETTLLQFQAAHREAARKQTMSKFQGHQGYWLNTAS